MDSSLSSIEERKSDRIEPIILVHGGTGNIADKYVAKVIDGVRIAARLGYEFFQKNCSVKDGVIKAVKVMENNPIFNAGRGSSVCFEGVIEMDAIIMDGQTMATGAVSCVRNVRNPIEAACMVMEESHHVLLGGIGAKRFVREKGLANTEDSHLITHQAMRIQMLQDPSSDEIFSKQLLDVNLHDLQVEEPQDEKPKDYAYALAEYADKIREKAKTSAKKLLVRALIALLIFPALGLAILDTVRMVFRHGGDIKGLVKKPKSRPLQPKILSDAKYGTKRYTQLKYFNAHYVQIGDKEKPLMILIHGFPEFWFGFRKQIEHYSKDFRIIALDMRGYGDSEKPVGSKYYKLEHLTKDVKHLIKKFSVDEDETAIVIGHDLGAAVVWNMVLMYPEYIQKYVALSIPPQYSLKLNLQQIYQSWYAIFFQLPILPELYLRAYDLELAYINDLYVGASEEEIEAYKFVLSKPGTLTSMLAHYRENVTKFVEYALFGIPDLKVLNPPPGILIYGDQDKYSNKVSYQNASNVPNLKVHQINAGHFITHQNADIVHSYIDEFLGVKITPTEPVQPSHSPSTEDGKKEDEQKPAEQKPKPTEEKPKPSEEKPKPSPEKPAEEKPSEEKPKPSPEKPAEEKPKPSEEKPKPSEEKPKPSEEKSTEEKPSEEKPTEEKPKPSEEKPIEEKPKPSEEKPTEPKPAEEKPAEQKPSEEKPAEQKPEETKPGGY